MPELPEVETVRRVLEPQLAGRTIEAADIRNPQVVAYPQAERFATLLQGQRIANLSRRGKFLTVHFDSGDRLVLHLRMTGELLALPAEEPIEKHTHLIFNLSDGRQLRYVDIRRFGRFWLFSAKEPDLLTGQASLGIEPTDDALTADYLAAKLGMSRRAVKQALLDQTVVAGIGNIYSDEILFAARVHPKALCADLDAADWARLAEKTREIILWGIEADTMSAEEYLRGKGREYRNMPYLRVYGRAGQPCVVCGASLEKATIGGRSGCFCPRCQRRKP